MASDWIWKRKASHLNSVYSTDKSPYHRPSEQIVSFTSKDTEIQGSYCKIGLLGGRDTSLFYFYFLSPVLQNQTISGANQKTHWLSTCSSHSFSHLTYPYGQSKDPQLHYPCPQPRQVTLPEWHPHKPSTLCVAFSNYKLTYLLPVSKRNGN